MSKLGKSIISILNEAKKVGIITLQTSSEIGQLTKKFKSPKTIKSRSDKVIKSAKEMMKKHAHVLEKLK